MFLSGGGRRKKNVKMFVELLTRDLNSICFPLCCQSKAEFVSDELIMPAVGQRRATDIYFYWNTTFNLLSRAPKKTTNLFFYFSSVSFRQIYIYRGTRFLPVFCVYLTQHTTSGYHITEPRTREERWENLISHTYITKACTRGVRGSCGYHVNSVNTLLGKL